MEGLSCSACAQRVRAAASAIDGVADIQVDPATGRLTVSSEAPLSHETVARAVRAAGYRLIERPRPSHRPILGFFRFLFRERNTALAGTLTVFGLTALIPAAPAWGSLALFAAAITAGGIPIARHAWQELRGAHVLGINALMVIAVAGAAAIGAWPEAAIVVALFSLGEALEGYAAEQARGALHDLLDLSPPSALRLFPDGRTAEVEATSLNVGDRVLVRPGDRVGADGVITNGESALDEAAITGESIPAEKAPGAPVFAGTINTSGALQIEVTRRSADSTLSRMVALVEEAQARRAPVQRFVDRFARIYTPTIAVAAGIVAAVPPLLFGQPFLGPSGWLMRALQMLVIACPCALVISTPVTLVSALANATRHAVLIKGGATLEVLARVDTFIFDKTGTLTHGRPLVTDVYDACSCETCSEDCGLLHAAAVEVQSSHPLADAVVAEARARGLELPRAEDVILLAGRGVEGTVNGRRVTVGSHSHFDEHVPHSPAICRHATELSRQGKTVVLVKHNEDVCALFGLADTHRSEASEAIVALRTQGIRSVMLTGDTRVVAEAIGRAVGIDDVRAELLPEDKLNAVANLQRTSRAVAMVGDGVNDAPALAQANVGIAMGGAGSAQAMETADAVLMGDDLRRLPFVVWLSRATRSTIATNIAFALAVKVSIFGLAAAGLATLWLAVLADVGSSFLVILYGMRLRRRKPPRSIQEETRVCPAPEARGACALVPGVSPPVERETP